MDDDVRQMRIQYPVWGRERKVRYWMSERQIGPERMPNLNA